MEHVLDIYKRPYDPDYPVVCMDETPRQLIRETRLPRPARPGRLVRYDFEYARCGVYNVFLASEPLAGRRWVRITGHKTRSDWAGFIRELAGHYPTAKKILLVMDNLNTHKSGSLYQAFPPGEAKRLWDRFEFVYTPRHGSWLNMAEIELNVLSRQCLNRRLDDMTQVTAEINAWKARRDNRQAKVQWHFSTDDARIKLRRLYPTLDA